MEFRNAAGNGHSDHYASENDMRIDDMRKDIAVIYGSIDRVENRDTARTG
ncbi:MAG: hypothetical protein IIB00_09435 [candidate division Zixibacteria bacterium]|nr:hypothetical protein [candidate division Zixibacteria bacterium]